LNVIRTQSALRSFMKKKQILISILCILSTILTCTSCRKKLIPEPMELMEQEAFNQYLDKLFADLVASDTLTLNYTVQDPSLFSIERSSPTLGNYSISSMQDARKKEASYLDCLSRFDYDQLSADQKLCYDMINETFSLNQTYQGYLLYDEILGPTTGIQAQLPILLAEYNYSCKEDVDDYLALLMDVPRYFKQISQFETQKSKAGLFMSDQVANEIIKQCRAFIEHPETNYLIQYFNERIADLDFLNAKERNEYQILNRIYVETYIIPAYRDLIASLTSLLGTGTNSSGLAFYQYGKDYYNYLVQKETGTAHSIPELITMMETTLSDSLLDIASYMHADSNIYQKVKDYTYIKQKPEDILLYLKKSIMNDFPELPNVNCNIKYVHESLQDYVSPAMYLTPQIDHYTDNCIYINTSPNYDISELFPTVAHEGYPGHLYQNVYFRSKEIHPIRNTFTNLGYEEGWATYAEAYSYSYAGLDSNVAAILKDNMVATHCIYSRTDIGIHYEGWAKKQAVAYISKYMPASSGEIVYQTLLEEPALYLPYCVGYLEITELKNQAMKELGEQFNIKEFHRFLLDHGPVTFNLLKNDLSDWISSCK